MDLTARSRRPCFASRFSPLNLYVAGERPATTVFTSAPQHRNTEQQPDEQLNGESNKLFAANGDAASADFDDAESAEHNTDVEPEHLLHSRKHRLWIRQPAERTVLGATRK